MLDYVPEFRAGEERVEQLLGSHFENDRVDREMPGFLRSLLTPRENFPDSYQLVGFQTLINLSVDFDGN